MVISIDLIQNKVWEIATNIDAPKSLTTIFSTSPQDGRPHIEINGGEFLLIFEERGFIFSVKKTNNLDIIMYWLFCSITFRMAQDYELQHRDEHNDARKVIFSKQLELMRRISVDWCRLLNDEIKAILIENPYLDCRGSPHP